MHEPEMKSLKLALVCAESEVPSEGEVITRVIKGKTIALARRDAESRTIVAFDSQCPHAQGPLKFGRVVDGEVVCPWHFMRFDTTTGTTVGCDSVMRLKTYDVEVVEQNVYVRLDS
jgi:nitrite reductase/ring-hydroxylating ferredoxin subunit